MESPNRRPSNLAVTLIETNPPQTAGFQPARLGGFLPQGFSPVKALCKNNFSRF
jgi:hypothetical protein